jgi:hypothetical protein
MADLSRSRICSALVYMSFVGILLSSNLYI